MESWTSKASVVAEVHGPCGGWGLGQSWPLPSDALLGLSLKSLYFSLLFMRLCDVEGDGEGMWETEGQRTRGIVQDRLSLPSCDSLVSSQGWACCFAPPSIRLVRNQSALPGMVVSACNPVLRKLMQKESHKFKASSSYMARPWLQTQQTKDVLTVERFGRKYSFCLSNLELLPETS